jgi:hypothetical protein
MKLSNKYKSSEYLFLFSILVLSLLLGTYFSFYAFLWRDIDSKVTGFSKYQMEGMKSNNNCCQTMTGTCECGENIECASTLPCNPQ